MASEMNGSRTEGILLLNSMLNSKDNQCIWKQYPKARGFRRNQKFCDVSIIVGERTFPCHRLVLASMSEYFDTMFGGNFIEAESTTVTLHDIDADLFESLLDFMYGGPLPEINGDTILDLLDASQYFGLDSIEDACCEFLDKVMFTSCVSTLNMPRIFSFLRSTTNKTALIKRITAHLLTHLPTLMQLDSFLELPYDDLRFILDEYIQSEPTAWVNEDFLVDGLIRWGRHAYDDRKKYARELMDVVDFEELSPEYVQFMAGRQPSGTDSVDSTAQPFPERKATTTIHLYKSTPTRTTSRARSSQVEYEVFSMREHKTDPEFYLSGGFVLPRKRVAIPFSMVASENLLYCVTQGRNNYDCTKFTAYAQSDLLDGKTLTIGSPMCDFRRPSLGMIGDCIYMYNPDTHDYDYTRSNCQDFTTEECKRGIYSYKCDIDAWFPVPEMRRKLASAGLVTSENLLFAIGGVDADGTAPGGYVQAYDSRGPGWMNLPAGDRTYSGTIATCYIGGKVYVTDGDSVIEVFDQVAGRWSGRIQLPHEGLSPLQKGGKLWLVPFQGQVHYFQKRCSFVSTLDPKTLTWSELISFEEEVFNDGPQFRISPHGVQNIIVFKAFQPWMNV